MTSNNLPEPFPEKKGHCERLFFNSGKTVYESIQDGTMFLRTCCSGCLLEFSVLCRKAQ